jgi:2-phosphoglycerate kinase
MIYLLGGPPRVGKSKISDEIRRKHAISVVSTDTLGALLEERLNPEAEPDLFLFEMFNEMPETDRVKFLLEDPIKLISYVRKESRVVWQAAQAFIGRENDEGRDALIEGVAVLPEWVRRLENIPHRAVFIGNQGKSHKENIRKSGEENETDWMRHASDRYIDAFALFVNRMSLYIEQEANRYGFEYIEMDKVPFENASTMVMTSLDMGA